MPRIRLFGLQINALGFDQAVDALTDVVEGPREAAKVVVTPNVDHIVRLERDRALKRAYARADFIFADGMPLVWFSRLIGRPLPERVTGADLMTALCRRLAAQGRKVAVLGGKPGQEAELLERFGQRYPGLVVDVVCPSMAFDPLGAEAEASAKLISDLRPDVVFVGLGMPKQELWALHFASRLPAGLVMCTGAAMSYALGMDRRAPVPLQKLGLEWLWRLAVNPRKLWRRYLLDDPRFLLLCLREWRKPAALV